MITLCIVVVSFHDKHTTDDTLNVKHTELINTVVFRIYFSLYWLLFKLLVIARRRLNSKVQFDGLQKQKLVKYPELSYITALPK